MDQSVTYDRSGAIGRAATGTMTEGLGGAAAVVLAILGLIGVLPAALGSVAVIAIGLSLLVEGGYVAAQYSRLLDRAPSNFSARLAGGDVTMEAMCGLAGIVLGILALLHLHEVALLSVSVLVFGGALLMASVTTARLSEIRMRVVAEGDRGREIAREALYSDTGSEMLMGVAAVVLGILALSGLDPLPIALVGLLCIGASVLLTGVSISARIAEAMFRA